MSVYKTISIYNYPLLVYLYIFYIQLPFLSSTTTTTAQSHSAIWYSTNTLNISIQNYFYIQLPFVSLLIYILYTTTLSLLYHHYHPTISFCHLVLNKDTQCKYTYIYIIYSTTLSFLYHHYHPTVSFCQLLLNKDTQC